MPNVAQVLKGEISRLSNKVVRAHVEPIRSATSVQRKQLSLLKKQVELLQREVAALRRTSAKAVPQPEAIDGAKYRFSAKGLRSLRSRLGLSAEEFGRLLQVSAQSIYKWENEKATPRRSQLGPLAELRTIGKREARSRLGAQPGA